MQDSVHTSQQTGDMNILQHCGKGLPQVRNKPDIWLPLATQTEPSWNWPKPATRMPMSEFDLIIYIIVIYVLSKGINVVPARSKFLVSEFESHYLYIPNREKFVWKLLNSIFLMQVVAC